MRLKKNLLHIGRETLFVALTMQNPAGNPEISIKSNFVRVFRPDQNSMPLRRNAPLSFRASTKPLVYVLLRRPVNGTRLALMSDALSERFTGRTPEASQRTSFVPENDTYGNIKINEEAIFKARFNWT